MVQLKKLRVWQLAMDVGNHVYGIVEQWDNFQRWTIGKQLIRSVDSIAANIAEGYGRYHYLDNRRFVYYSRGSAFEALTWIEKARARQLLSDNEYASLIESLDHLTRMINRYVSRIGPQHPDHPNDE